MSQTNGNSDLLARLSADITELSEELRSITVVDITSTAETIFEYLRREWRRSDATQTKFRILNALTIHAGTQRLTDLSRTIFRTKFAVKRAVDRLERDGLVRRESPADDRREKPITITEKGLQFVESTMGRRRAMSDEITNGLNEEELTQLSDILRRIRRHVRTCMP